MPFKKIKVPVSKVAPTGVAYVYDPKGKLHLPPAPRAWKKQEDQKAKKPEVKRPQ